ncbi:MAG: aldehyde dehydrogenase family protein, partial [Candidatus Methanomethylophilaceae archaeon]|nr:aldehyde dehydrogenase family protein [Candidatus Methanomethylophilaceae archaeon]
ANYRSRRLFYAASVTVSTGMVREDALSEVDAFISAVESAITEAKSMKGKPTGVWAIVSEHNSPLASPAGAAVACMLGGNCVIMNPTRDAPYPIYQFYEACEKAGLPGGVMNLVVDRKLESTQDLVCDMRLSGVVASGSGKRMDDLMFMMIDDELRFVYDIKGMNPALVYRPADMKATVKDIIESAFAYSGQRLYSCSKVIVLMEDQKRFMDVLTEYMKDVKVDDPVNDTAFAGPLISMDAAKSYRETVERHLEFVVAKGSAVINLPDNYVRPVAVTGIPLEDSLDYEDTGLPILDVKVVDSLESAFEELEDTECGLSAGLFSKDQKVIDRFKKQVDVPLQYINKSSRTLAHGLPAKVSLYTK